MQFLYSGHDYERQFLPRIYNDKLKFLPLWVFSHPLNTLSVAHLAPCLSLTGRPWSGHGYLPFPAIPGVSCLSCGTCSDAIDTVTSASALGQQGRHVRWPVTVLPLPAVHIGLFRQTDIHQADSLPLSPWARPRRKNSC